MPDLETPSWIASKSGRIEHISGKPYAWVALAETQKRGFAWGYKKRVSYSPTLAEAREWVETIAEYDSVPGLSYLNVMHT